LRYNYLLGEER